MQHNPKNDLKKYMYSQRTYFTGHTLHVLLLIWLICLQMLSVAGLVSIVLGYITFVVFLLFCEKHTRPFALLVFGNMVFNYVAHLYNIRGAGFVVLVPLVLLLLLFSWQHVLPLLRNVPKHIGFLAACLGMWWFVSWLFGPRTDYATLRFASVTSQLIIGAVALAWCLADGKNGLLKAGMLGMVVVTIQTCINNQYYPLSTLTLGAWKSDLTTGIEAMVGPRLLGIAILLIFNYCLRNPRFPWLLFALTLLCVAIPMFAADSRQTYLGLTVGCCGFLVGRTVRWRAILLLAVIVAATTAVFLVGLEKGHGRYTVFFDSDRDFIQKTGRPYHLQAGVDTWLKSPVVGVGMGGFESISPNVPQGRSYPHNLILEMLAETGVIGCLLGMGFLAVCLAQIYKYPTVYLKNLNQMLPFWLYVLMLAMVSLDISWNVPVFYYPLGVILASNLPRNAKSCTIRFKTQHISSKILA